MTSKVAATTFKANRMVMLFIDLRKGQARNGAPRKVCGHLLEDLDPTTQNGWLGAINAKNRSKKRYSHNDKQNLEEIICKIADVIMCRFSSNMGEKRRRSPPQIRKQKIFFLFVF